MLVCHRCDTPVCVNLAHLFVGTASDNVQDMHQKGRAKAHGKGPAGERARAAKLVAKQVLAIRGDRRPANLVALDYGVTARSIQMIRAGVTWRHV